jgi:hypothetical protein
MCHSRQPGSCIGCGHGVTRRGFIKGCGVALATTGGLASAAGRAEGAGQKPVRVALVYLSKERPSWPYPEFDIEAREKEILGALKEGCRGVEFVLVAVRDPADVQKAVAIKDDVAAYLVYAVTLTWPLTSAITTLGKLSKPMVVADEYVGGSGVFLVGFSRLSRQGSPACGVATTRMSDLVAVARCFADLKPDTTPEAFAKTCQAVYQKTFAPVGEMKCLDDPVKLTGIGEAVERFKKSRFLIVGRGKPGQEQDFLGAKGRYVGFEELQAIYDKVDQDQAAEWAKRWIQQADKVVEPTPDWIQKAGAVYLATLELLKRYDTDTVTANCLGGFAAGKLPAYPCLGFMQLMNDGAHGVCEAMPDDTLSVLMARILTGRASYVSDPVLDTAKNQIVYAHCVATTKALGTDGPSNMFRIRTLHNHDPRGTCAQSFLPEGYMTTSFRTNFARKAMVIHQAKAVGNLDAPRGCRTQLIGEVRGDIAKLFYQWDRFGWHRVTVYGDVKEPLVEFGKALGLSIIEET